VGPLHPRFALLLRADDRPVLEEIVERTGLGHVAGPYATSRGRPAVRWLVSSKADSAALCRLLDAHPLRSRKRHDYEVWRRAVAAWQAVTTRGGNEEAWARVGACRAELLALRTTPAL